jgi:tetratricopeptide (TPR) repeat protein
MGLVSRQAPDSVPALIRLADRAVAKKRYRKAIRAYRRALAAQAGNASIHAKLAPILAQKRQRFDAWLSFRAAAKAFLRDGQPHVAEELYAQATRRLPRELQAWVALGQVQQSRRKTAEAMRTFVEGSLRFRRRRHLPQAIHLLRMAHKIHPSHLETTLDLARCLAKTRQQDEALLLLQVLAEKADPIQLPRIYAARWRISRRLGHAWAWFRSVLARRFASQDCRKTVRGDAAARPPKEEVGLTSDWHRLSGRAEPVPDTARR